jgi:hypothetical protein
VDCPGPAKLAADGVVACHPAHPTLLPSHRSDPAAAHSCVIAWWWPDGDGQTLGESSDMVDCGR